MPKRPAKLPEGRYPQRDRFVTRLMEEQERRGWSDSRLAERASEYFPMSAATVWKIKGLEPPRRVDLDEAYAIARAFGHPSLDKFLRATTAASKITESVDEATVAIDGITRLEVFNEVRQSLEENAGAAGRAQLKTSEADRITSSVDRCQQSLHQTSEWFTTEVAETDASLQQFRSAVSDSAFKIGFK